SAPRAQKHERCRRGDGGGVYANSPPRSRPCRAAGLLVEPPAPLAGAVRPVVEALPTILSAKSGQSPLRQSFAAVVRTEPPGRGFRRDLCGVADAPLELAQALCPMARAEETAICRRADGCDRRPDAARHAPHAGRPADPADPAPRRPLRKETGPPCNRPSEDLPPRSSTHLLRRSETSPLADGLRVSTAQPRQD